MRLQPPDQLSTVLIWLSAIFMATKQGVESWPAAREAMPAMSAGWLNFVPLVLLAVAAGVTIYRSTSPREAAQSAPPAGPDQGREAASLFPTLHTAHRNARAALADASPSARERVAEIRLPAVRAAMLSAQKAFGTPMPPEEGTTLAMELEFHLRVLEEMLPYLREGHVDEARSKAQAVIDYVMDRRPAGKA